MNYYNQKVNNYYHHKEYKNNNNKHKDKDNIKII